MLLSELPGTAPCGDKRRPFFKVQRIRKVVKTFLLEITFGETEIFESDGSFAARGGFRIVANELVRLLKRKRLPNPALTQLDFKVGLPVQKSLFS